MSNFLAIATVTASLGNFLQGEVSQDVPGASVTTLRPDGTDGGNVDPRLNIYAYQVTPNGSMRNADVATRRADGSLLQRPQAALDVHYLLSFYGNEAELIPQRMLGSVVRTLHAQPLLTRAVIQSTIREARFNFLSNSDLSDQVERVRFTPTALNLEELSKLWSVFFQVRYTISVAYRASVVLLESDETPRSPLPVRDRNIYILPFRQLTIEQVQSVNGPRDPILPTSRLKIMGKQLQGRGRDLATATGTGGQALQGQETLVRIGDTVAEPTQVSETEIEVDLSNVPVEDLRAGIQRVQVVQPLWIGTPPTKHQGLESNMAAIVLHPTMTVGDVNSTPGNPASLRNGTLTLEAIRPLIGRKQRVLLLLNEFQRAAEESAQAYQFEAPALNGIPENSSQESTDRITFPFKDVAVGTYLVRVQVDGAESLLTFAAADPARPEDQQYIQPQVEIV